VRVRVGVRVRVRVRVRVGVLACAGLGGRNWRGPEKLCAVVTYRVGSGGRARAGARDKGRVKDRVGLG